MLLDSLSLFLWGGLPKYGIGPNSVFCCLTPALVAVQSEVLSCEAMMILVTTIFFIVLVSLTLYLYVAGVFHTSPLGAFRFAVYMLLLFFALTMGIGIVFNRDNPAVVE